MHLFLHRLTLQDLPLLQRLGRDTYEPYYPDVWHEGGMEWYLEHCFGTEVLRRELADPTIEYYVPMLEHQPVGIIKLHPNKPAPNGGCDNATHLEKLYLLPEFYGKGIGQLLIEQLCRRASAQGRAAIWLHVMHRSGPLKSYEKAGFKVVGSVHFDFSLLKDSERDGHVMLRWLDIAAAAPAAVEIIEYNSRYASDFKRLNLEWISRYFVVEKHDLEQLEQPDKFILAPGGQIFFARIGDQIVGTVAMAPDGTGQYELAKMAVDDAWKGYQIGKKLGQAALAWARERGATSVFLLSNRRLSPALQLYHRLGFREVSLGDVEYERADIKMEVMLRPQPSFRRVDANDIETLVALARDTFVTTFAHLNDPANFDAYVKEAFTNERFEAELAHRDSEFWYVEISPDSPIGYYKINHNTTPLDSPGARIDVDTTGWDTSAMAEIQRIYLLHDYHGLGIAQAMMLHAEDRARARGANYLWLGVWDQNQQSRRYYAKCGFEPIGAHTFLLGNDPQIDILVWKSLY
jgi:putative acetyltransferase